MFNKLCLRAREQHGAARPLILAVAVVLILAVSGATLALGGSSASAWSSGDASAQNLAVAAANAAETLAEANQTYSHTGLLPLHKNSAVPIAPSSSSAWVSAASGESDSFSVTATAEPSGDTYTVAVSSTGAVVRSCTVTASAGADTGCQHASGSANGTW